MKQGCSKYLIKSLTINAILFIIIPTLFYIIYNKNVESSLAILAGTFISIYIIRLRTDWNLTKRIGYFIMTIIFISIAGTLAIFPVGLIFGKIEAIGMIGYSSAGLIYCTIFTFLAFKNKTLPQSSHTDHKTADKTQ